MELKLISYNCKGFNISKVPYIQKLLDECNILFIQESWLYPVWLQSKRVCAIKIVLEHGEYYLLNVYMPCNVSTCIDSYVEVLSEISNYCLCNNVVHFVIGGDFNTDVTRQLMSHYGIKTIY